jgi:hypothetical protein
MKNSLPEFLEKIKSSQEPTSILNEKKVEFIYSQLEIIQQKNIPGLTAEIGVFRGGTSFLIHSMLPHKLHICYDTFEGILGASEENDNHKNGEFSCSLEVVQKNIGSSENIIYKKGMFPETFAEQHTKFCFVHSDTDTYLGTKATLDCFTNIMSPGGMIIFDDFEWKNCPGVAKALEEFSKTDLLFDHFKFAEQFQYLMIKK